MAALELEQIIFVLTNTVVLYKSFVGDGRVGVGLLWLGGRAPKTMLGLQT